MTGEPISLKHKDLLEPKLKAVNVPISEYSFQNLYLFRGTHEYLVFEKEGFVFVKGVTYDGGVYIMPAGDIRKIPCPLLKELQQQCDFFFPVCEEWLDHFHGKGFEARYTDGDTDYIYTAEKMKTYPGRKLHKKRNLLKQFNESYTATASMINPENIKDAYAILDEWQENTGGAKGDTDYYACREALDLYQELGVCGGIYYADGEPAAFILGEELTQDTYVMHFAKGLTKFKGVYQYIYNDFANILPKKYEFINYEQDLGSIALRMAKTSYIPDRLMKKYRLKFII